MKVIHGVFSLFESDQTQGNPRGLPFFLSFPMPPERIDAARSPSFGNLLPAIFPLSSRSRPPSRGPFFLWNGLTREDCDSFFFDDFTRRKQNAFLSPPVQAWLAARCPRKDPPMVPSERDDPPSSCAQFVFARCSASAARLLPLSLFFRNPLTSSSRRPPLPLFLLLPKDRAPPTFAVGNMSAGAVIFSPSFGNTVFLHQ